MLVRSRLHTEAAQISGLERTEQKPLCSLCVLFVPEMISRSSLFAARRCARCHDDATLVSCGWMVRNGQGSCDPHEQFELCTRLFSWKQGGNMRRRQRKRKLEMKRLMCAFGADLTGNDWWLCARSSKGRSLADGIQGGVDALARSEGCSQARHSRAATAGRMKQKS